MTREEFMMISAAIKTYYPKDNMLPTKEAMELWYRMLKDIPYKQAEQILENHVSVSDFPPTIATFRRATVPEGITESEAWAMVHKAIQNSANSSKEEFDKLPPDIQKAVGSANSLKAMALDEDFNLGVESSNFKRSYRQVKEKTEKMQALPESLRISMNKLKFLGGTENE